MNHINVINTFSRTDKMMKKIDSNEVVINIYLLKVIASTLYMVLWQLKLFLTKSCNKENEHI